MSICVEPTVPENLRSQTVFRCTCHARGAFFHGPLSHALLAGLSPLFLALFCSPEPKLSIRLDPRPASAPAWYWRCCHAVNLPAWQGYPLSSTAVQNQASIRQPERNRMTKRWLQEQCCCDSDVRWRMLDNSLQDPVSWEYMYRAFDLLWSIHAAAVGRRRGRAAT